MCECDDYVIFMCVFLCVSVCVCVSACMYYDSAYAMMVLHPVLLYVIVLNVKAILRGLSVAFCDGSAEANDASTLSVCVCDVSDCPLLRFMMVLQRLVRLLHPVRVYI